MNQAGPPLLERDRELAALRSTWRSAQVGSGQAYLLCAEAGGGKTRLAAEAVRTFGGRMRWGAAEPVAPPEPFLAVARALPEFAPRTERGASIALALGLIEHIAADDPLLLVFDDLQFADEGTVAVVARIMAVCAERPWLLLAAFRPGEGPTRLLAPLIELAAQGAARRLDLQPLSPSAVAAIARGMNGGHGNTADIDRLCRDTGGNPWLVQALARSDGTLAMVRDRINVRLDRLEQLAPGTRRLLEALAPAAGPLSHRLVTRLGARIPDLRATLTRLRDARILDDRDGDWTFQHELFRQALLDGMLSADRRKAHRTLAELLAGIDESATPTGERGVASGPASAASIAMHFSEAGDDRTLDWALRAATEAAAVDAHSEALAQYERALAFAPQPDQRRGVLLAIAVEAHALGRFTDSRKAAETALGLPDGDPETVARLHQVAARACFLAGDLVADEAHLEAAEAALAGRPISSRTADIALARVARAALALEPPRLERAIERLQHVSGQIDDPKRAAWLRIMIVRYRAIAQIERGDPAGFDLLERLLATPGADSVVPETTANALLGAYEESVIALFHKQAAELVPRVLEAIRQRELRWEPLIAPYQALELVQAGSYAQARTLLETIPAPAEGTIEQAVRQCALVLLETRAGSLDRATAWVQALDAGNGFQRRALCDFARLAVAMETQTPGLGELAQALYGTMNRHRYARIAGVAALALARAGRGVAPPPAWLAPDAPLLVFWRWAAALDAENVAALRGVAADLQAMGCPFESAEATADAGDIREAYRALRDLGATHPRARLAEELRRTAQRIPRKRRDAADATGLTETERRICTLLVEGGRNESIAAHLVISVRTVETHLTNIYRKTGCRGRTSLAAWWLQQRSQP